VIVEMRREATRRPLNRHERLAGDVAAEYQVVDAVEATGVDELPKAAVGAVDVGREEDPAALATRANGAALEQPHHSGGIVL
jgi:hypothetical protein